MISHVRAYRNSNITYEVHVVVMADYARSLWGNFCDAAFLHGAAFAIYQSSQAILSLLKGFRTYFVPLGRAVNTDLVTRFGEWAGGFDKG